MSSIGGNTPNGNYKVNAVAALWIPVPAYQFVFVILNLNPNRNCNSQMAAQQGQVRLGGRGEGLRSGGATVVWLFAYPALCLCCHPLDGHLAFTCCSSLSLRCSTSIVLSSCSCCRVAVVVSPVVVAIVVAVAVVVVGNVFLTSAAHKLQKRRLASPTLVSLSLFLLLSLLLYVCHFGKLELIWMKVV